MWKRSGRAAAGRTLAANTVIGFIGPPATDAISAAVCGGGSASRRLTRMSTASRSSRPTPSRHLYLRPSTRPLRENQRHLPLSHEHACSNDADHTAAYRTHPADGHRARNGWVPSTTPPSAATSKIALPQAAEILAQNLRSVLPPAVNAFGHVRQERSSRGFHADGRDRSASDTYAASGDRA